MEIEDYQHPHSSEEARYLLEQAIDAGEFEKIPFYQQEIESLINYEEVVRLGKEVNEYYKEQTELNASQTHHYAISKKQLDSAIQNSNKFYRQKFKETKKRQKEEMEALITRWSEERNKKNDKVEVEFERTFCTAKLLAKQGKVQEAIDLRDAAIHKKENTCNKHQKEIDEKYERRCSIMTERHKTELENLIAERKQEIKGFQRLQEEADTQATGDFIIDNASVVIDITKRFNGNATTQHSLTMECINAQPNVTLAPASHSSSKLTTH